MPRMHRARSRLRYGNSFFVCQSAFGPDPNTDRLPRRPVGPGRWEGLSGLGNLAHQPNRTLSTSQIRGHCQRLA